jgi:hypothetical protein
MTGNPLMWFFNISLTASKMDASGKIEMTLRAMTSDTFMRHPLAQADCAMLPSHETQIFRLMRIKSRWGFLAKRLSMRFVIRGSRCLGVNIYVRAFYAPTNSAA